MKTPCSLFDIHGLIDRGDYDKADGLVTELLARQPHDWANCHFAGVYFFWRALDAERALDAVGAERAWQMSLPHLAFALENTAYLTRFRLARQKAYATNEGISEQRMRMARDQVYNVVESRLMGLAKVYGESNQNEEKARLQQILARWKLERLGARLTQRVGGVPVDSGTVTYVAAGPMYARQYGFYESAQTHISQLKVRERSLADQFLDLIKAKPADASGELTAQVKREAGYCFSQLDMAFLFYSERQNGQALEELKRLAEAGGETQAAASAGLVGEAAKTRLDARQLAMGIRVAVGSEALHQDGEGAGKALAFWGEALKDAEILDANNSNLLERQGGKIREHIQKMIGDRVAHLSSQNHWDEALSLAEGLARIMPREMALVQLANLLVQRALYCANKQKDHWTAVELLRRTRILRPNDSLIKHYLLTELANCLYDLAERKEYRAVVEKSVDLIGMAQEILAAAPNDAEAHAASRLGAKCIRGLMGALDPKKDEQLVQFAVAALTVSEGGALPVPYDKIEAIRRFHCAYDLAQKGKFIEAFREVDEAIHLDADNELVKRWYPVLASRAVHELCEQGVLDRAGEIADRAHQTVGGDLEICRCRARVMVRRLGREKLLSENPEDIATLITMVTNWLGEDQGDTRIQEKARKIGTLLDSALQNERKLNRVQQLMKVHRWREALRLIGELQLEGRDDYLAKYFAAQCQFHLNDLGAALEIADRLVAEYPLPHARFYRGKLLSCAGRFDAAESDLMAFRESDDKNYESVLELGMNSFRAGRYREAAASARLARENGVDVLQTISIECMYLMQERREREIPAVVAQTADRHKKDEKTVPFLKWLAGELDDEGLMQHADRVDAEGGDYFWLGIKARIDGHDARGNALIEKCLARNGTHTYEYEHALAMKNGGRMSL